MKIKVSTKKWHSASMDRDWKKLADYVCSHYPKDAKLHAAVRGCFTSADKAAMKAGKRAASDYVEEMRRNARDCGDDLEVEANSEAARLEAAYTQNVLHALIASGGEGERL